MKPKVLFSLFMLLSLTTLNTLAQDIPYTSPEGHTAPVNSVAFSSDGQVFASGGADGTIRLWDAATGSHIRVLGHPWGVSSVAFSPDGLTLASGASDGTIRLWEVSTGKHIRTLEGHTGSVNSVAFSPLDGQTLASGSGPWGWSEQPDNTVRLWEVSTGKHIRTLEGHTGSVNSVAFSLPDGQTLASGSSDNTVRLWEVSTGKYIRTLGHATAVTSVAFSPLDGQILASSSGDGRWGSDNTIRLWEVSTGKNINTLTGHGSYVNSVAFSPDGLTLASGGGDGWWASDKAIRLWEVSTGKNINTLTGHTEPVYSVAFSPDGQKIASGSSDYTVRLWEIGSGEHQTTTPIGHTAAVSSVAFSPDGQALTSVSSDGTVRLWEVSTGKYIRTLEQTGDVNSVAFSPDGLTLASGDQNHKIIRLWEVSTGKLLNTLTGHTGPVYSVAFSPDGLTLASGSWDRTIRLWEVSTGKNINTLTGHTGDVSSVVFSLPNGLTLASGSGARDGSSDNTVRLWEVSTGKLLNTLTGHRWGVNSVAFSPDGLTLASGGSDDTIRLWEVSTGKHIRTLEGHTAAVNSVAFSPDGLTLASGSGENYEQDDTVRLWEVSTGTHLRTLTGHTGWVNSVAFHPDGLTLASGSSDNTVRLWTLPATRVRITPDPVPPPAVGEQFTVNVSITAGKNVGGYQASLAYDATVLRYVESANADYLPAGAFFTSTVLSENTVKLGAASLAGVSNGDGTLATVTFEVLDVKESVIDPFDVSLTDSAGERFALLAHSARVDPRAVPSSAVVRLSPASVVSPAVGEQITFNVDIVGGQDVANHNLTFDTDSLVLKQVNYEPSNYHIDAGGDGQGDGTLGTVTYQVLAVKAATVHVSGYLVASNKLRHLPTFESASVTVPKRGDVNSDGVVNILDLTLVAASFGQPVPANGTPADVNADGQVDIVDLVLVAGALGEGAAAPSVWQLRVDTTLTRADVQHWLTQARHANLTDAVSQRGIRFLEQLLTALTPKETALLPNYPNPFNPETWIPYQLATPADVALTIYDIHGHVVRALDLGHQPIGIYQSRALAAYWDGRNAQGEPVASGVYFYTLKAGDFTATRKMLIRK